MTWKLIHRSVQGSSHVRLGIPCQDYCSAKRDGTTLVVACADGAGSAELSQLGAQAVVDGFLQVASTAEPPTKIQIEEWVTSARECLLRVAKANQSNPRQLACTFLGAMVGDGWVAFAQIGDGAIVFNGHEGLNLAFWPDNGEYANTTHFLSEDDYRDYLRVEILERQIVELAVLTDGLQMLALDITNTKVHDRFFIPLFQTVRNGADEESLQIALAEFLNSKRVNERTDDDKTLILATRITADVSKDVSGPVA